MRPASAVTAHPHRNVHPSDLSGFYMHLRNKVHPYSYIGDLVKDWGELCRLIDENNINAVHYMRWAWGFYTRHRPIAYVNMLNTPKSVKIYMDTAAYTEKDRETELCIKLDIQKDVVQTELTFGRELHDILLDESLVIGVVLRYALAFSGGLEELVRRFCAEAEYEITCEPLYRQLIGDKLPPVKRVW